MHFRKSGTGSMRASAWALLSTLVTVAGMAAAFVVTAPEAESAKEAEGTGEGYAAIATNPATVATATRIDRAAPSSEGAGAAAAAGGDLVYSNTSDTLLFPPGIGRNIGDDVRTLAGCGCTLENYELRVGGGGDGTGPGFTLTYGLYTDCPELGGELIEGTGGSIFLPDNGDFNVVVTPASPVAVPRRFWALVSFDTDDAGWYCGSPADANLGVTGDYYYFQDFSCNAVIGSGFFAGFNMRVFCDPAGGPGPASQPVPGDGASNVEPLSQLSWLQPGSFLNAPVNGPISSGSDEMIAGEAGGTSDAASVVTDGSWVETIPPGQSCGTFERWLAKGGGQGQEGSVAGGCGTLGQCDEPTFRDGFIPDGTTPEKVYRLHYHIFCLDNGAGCTSSVSEVNGLQNAMNADYAPFRISFEHEISTHNDTTFRDWTGSEEGAMKSLYAVDPAETLNIYIVNVDGQYSFGTFPWDGDALTFLGGVVMNNGQFSVSSSTPTHEVGHCLGLWHTHHGVSEVSQCSGCYEEAGTDSSTTGDYCADTDPTPTNFFCSPPGGSDPCSATPWGTTDLQNYMSYSSCRNEFSDQQAGRMHCWSEDVLTGWLLAQCGATYDVYLDTTNPPTQLACNDVTEPTCDPGPLDCNTTYYWRVDVTSTEGGGTTIGEVWSFNTPGGPDCNSNGTADACDIAFGGSSDCNANNQPDECETDCNSNGIADTCDIDGGGSLDCDTNSVPDECDPDADGDSVPDACDICAGGDDTQDADADGVPDFCDICSGGDDNQDTDADGVPNFCDTCPLDNPDDADGDGVCTSDDNCALFNPEQLDCQPNGVGDVCDIDSGGSTDANENGQPDECEISTPFAEDSLGTSCVTDGDCPNLSTCSDGQCYVSKNRYISIAPNVANAGNATARRITLDLGGSSVVLGWAGAPDGNSVSRIVDAPFYTDWSAAGVVHIGDCHISPNRTYLVHAILSGSDIGNEASYSPALTVPTTATFGDVGGSVVAGTLQPPDGTTNFADIQSIVAGFQQLGQAPNIWLDLDGQAPNYVVALADVQQAVVAFQGQPYGFDDPCSCEDLTPCP